MLGIVYTQTVKPPDIIKIYLSFLGFYTEGQTTQIRMRLLQEGRIIPISIKKPIFRDMEVIVSPTYSMSVDELIEYVRSIASNELGFATNVNVSDFYVQTSTEFRQEQEQASAGIMERLTGGKSPVEMLTGLSPTYVVLGALGALGLFIYFNQNRR